MTIYSRHPHRGKVQILATFRGDSGITSSTVTSVGSVALAEPIVDALNRISASATAPVSTWDTRHGPTGDFPRDHLVSLSDPDVRPRLLEGAHSLWYVLTMWLLHHALSDLDKALAAVPPPVRTAVDAELEAEATWLERAIAGAEGAEGAEETEEEGRRLWDHGDPFIYLSDIGLDAEDRERLDEHELDDFYTDAERLVGADDLRLMLEADSRSAPSGFASLHLDGMHFFIDPFDADRGEERFYLEVGPLLADSDSGWGFGIGNWEAEEFDAEGEVTGATGSLILEGLFLERPSVEELTAMLNARNSQIADWATAAVGDQIDGTSLVVVYRRK